jgi:Tfp pilus assembly protein PilV
MHRRTTISHRGAGLIEVVVAAAILVIVVVGIASAHRLLIRSSRQVIYGTQAALLAEEGLEAVRVLRDSAWANIASSTVDTSYTLVWTGSTWGLSASPTLIDGVFDRRVTFGSVHRNSDDDIAASGALDDDTYRVDVTVSWHTGFSTTSRTMSSYIGNIFE